MPRNTISVCYVATVASSLHYLLLAQMVELTRAGYTVSCASSSGPSVDVIKSVGIRHNSVPLTRRITPVQDLLSLLRLFRLFRRSGFVIVHTHTPKANLLGQLAAWLAGVPVRISTVHGFYFSARMAPIQRRLFQVVERVSALFADLVFVVNREDFETARSLRIFRPNKLRLLPAGIGIDLRRFDGNALSRDVVRAKREELNLGSAAPVVGFVGRLVQEKGLLDLLSAARIVRERVPEVRFLIVGPVDTEKPDAITPAMAEQYHVAECCIFTGLRHDTPYLYAMMDVFVLPSYREGMPLSPMEASAMGIPCVVTDVRGCREVVEHHRNGLLVPPGDVEALAAAIIELLMDKEKARRMGEEGRRMALERFDERLVFEKIKAEYERLLREKGLPVPEPAFSVQPGYD